MSRLSGWKSDRSGGGRSPLSVGVGMWLGMVAIIGCDARGPAAVLDAVRPEAIDAHLRFLAANQLQGRAPGTREGALAAQYIATQFATAGLEPAVGDTSYQQRFRLIAARPSSRLELRARGGAALRPRAGEDYIAWATAPVDSMSARGELIFVGYGITAPDLDWDDYKGVDVAGAILLILAGEPPSGGERFRGDTLTRYGQTEYKLSEAWRRGADGAFIVEASPEAALVRERLRFARATERLYLAPSESGRVRIAGWLTREGVEQIAGIGGLDFNTLLVSAAVDRFRPVASGVTAAIDVENTISERVGANVAGLLRGSDPERSSEMVLFTAHYDALGVGPAVSDDSIYNGAYDNASGVALLLTLADGFGRGVRPARSLLFLATTASEAGRLGSRHYTSRPLHPLERTVAVLNLDGVNLWGPTRDIALVDGGATDLYAYAERAAAAEDLDLRREILPAAGMAFSSDQITFLRAGVPAALIEHGVEYVGRMPGWGERMLAGFFAERLHTPSDEYEGQLDLGGAVQQGRFAARVGELIANGERRPTLLQEGADVSTDR